MLSDFHQILKILKESASIIVLLCQLQAKFGYVFRTICMSCNEHAVDSKSELFRLSLCCNIHMIEPECNWKYCIQLFRERLSEKLCTRQSRKAIWDMINTLFLTTVAVEPTFVAFLSLALANTFPWPFVPIVSNFFEKKRTQNHPQCLSGLSPALFPTTFLEIAV